MKRIYAFFTALLFTVVLWAQSPEQMSYQAVMRNSDNELVINQNIGIQIRILQFSPKGSVVYLQFQKIKTNANGMISIEIGVGENTEGDFSLIDWAAGPYFIETAVDLTGGDSYSVTGTSQLLSVPYALHAKTAENTINDKVNDLDSDPTNETIDSFTLSGTNLVLVENGVTHTVSLSDMIQAEIQSYVQTNCKVYFGWRDSCNGCTSPPSKYGWVKADGTGMVEAGNDCDFSNGWLKINTDGNVDGDDNFYIKFVCE